MNNPWKLTTIGLVLVLITAITTGLTTAHFTGSLEPAVSAGSAPATVSPAVLRGAPVATRPVSAPAYRPATVTHVATRPTPVSTVDTTCETGGQRAWRVAQPGLIGAAVGVGLGAAGGAIADGGKGAGRGALIGGIAGTALGAGYGLYKTHQECGTIFGGQALGSAVTDAAFPQAIQAARGLTAYQLQ
jgi:hypothetical protein